MQYPVRGRASYPKVSERQDWLSTAWFLALILAMDNITEPRYSRITNLAAARAQLSAWYQ